MADSTQSSQQQSSGQSTATSSGGQYFFDPRLAQDLSSALGGLQQSLIPQYQSFISNPTAHPLYQNQLSGLLASLAPSEAQARQGLTDTFRAAGGLRSGAYGYGASNLEGNLMANRQELASKLLGQVFPQVTQSLQQPMSQISALLQALQLSQQQSQSQSTQQSTGSSSGSSSTPQQQQPQQSSTQPNAAQLLSALSSATRNSGSTGYGTPTTPTNPNAGASDIYSVLTGGGSGVTYNPVTGYYESAPAQNLGTYSPAQGGPTYPAPTPEYNPTTGAYQGGYQINYSSDLYPYTDYTYPSSDYASTGMEY
jgi:hypothetical protein